MDKIRELIGNLLNLKVLPEGSEDNPLAGFSAEQLAAAESKAREAFSAAKESRDLEAIELTAATIQAAVAEVTRRDTVEKETEARITALETAIAPVAVVETPEPDPEPEDEEEEAVTPEVAAPPVAEIEVPVAEETVAERIAASVSETTTSTTPAPDVTITTPVVPTATGKPKSSKPLATITASGDVNGYTPGQAMRPDDIGEAFVTKGTAIKVGHQAGRSGVATIHVDYPDNRTLSSDDNANTNTAKIMEVVAAAQEETRRNLQALLASSDPAELEELTAAGGLCAPVNVRYDIFTVGSDARPLRDSFTRFGANRGGIRFNSPPVLVDVDGSVAVYLEADDDSGSRYPKDCIRVDCGADNEVEVSAITLCMEVGNFQRLSFPENFRAWWQLGKVHHAREAETTLWNRMDTLSTAVTAGEGLGAYSDSITQIIRAASQYRWRHRILPETPLRLRAPAFLRDIMKVDLLRRAAGDNQLAPTNADIARGFAAHNIAVTFILDAQSPGGTSGDIQAAGALNPWPSTVEVNLAIDGVFLFLDMGRLDFGTEIRDFDQIRQNDVGAFLETFENLAMVGPTPIQLTLNICPDGTTAGVDANFAPCVTGS